MARRSLLLASCLILAAGLSFVQAHLNRARAAWPRPEERALVLSPSLARAMSIGYHELGADLAWIRALIYYGDGLDKGTELPDAEPMIWQVIGLDPTFEAPYRWGAHALVYRHGTATQDEFLASIRILEQAIERFPEQWEFFWTLGLRYSYDLRSKDAAQVRGWRDVGAGYLERAMSMPGAPATLALNVANLRTELGQKDRALRELRGMILNTDDPEGRKRLERRYAALADEAARSTVAEAKDKLDAAWKASLPFAPSTLYVLLGPRPTPWQSLEDLTSRPIVEEDEEGGP